MDPVRYAAALVETPDHTIFVVRYSMRKPFGLPTFTVDPGVSEVRALERGLSTGFPELSFSIRGKFDDDALPRRLAGNDVSPRVYALRGVFSKRPSIRDGIVDVGFFPHTAPRLTNGLRQLLDEYRHGAIAPDQQP